MNINAPKAPLFSHFLSSFISFNSIQTSARSLFPPGPPSAVGQQRDPLPIGSLSIFLATKKREREGSTTRDLQYKPHRLLLNFQPFPHPPPLFAGLSLQADHVPEYHRSLSSHSLRSCNLLRPQWQQAALSLFVVCSLFFHVFLKGRGARTGCYHHTCFHSAALAVALRWVSTKLKFNELRLFSPLCAFRDDL